MRIADREDHAASHDGMAVPGNGVGADCDDVRRTVEAYRRRWVAEGVAHAAMLYAGRRVVHFAERSGGVAVVADNRRTLEHEGLRVLVEQHDGEWCASIAYRREDGVHRPLMAAFALDDVGALRELYAMVRRSLKAVELAGKLAVKLRG